MSAQTLVSFPTYIGLLGGAPYLRIGVRFVWVHVGDKDIRVPRSAFQPGELDCGMRAAERARVWSYRNARH